MASDLISVENRLKEAFDKIKEEFSDHLEAINQNTNEIQANFEFLQQIEKKLDKVNEKIEMLMMTLDCSNEKLQESQADALRKIRLTLREQEIFIILYTASDFMSYVQIAKQVGLTESLVSNYVTNLLEKKIPIQKRYAGNNALIRLEPWFKQIQAKENVIELNPKIAKEYIT
jgi:hypothetical protein